MGEWLYEDGIGERRAALIENGRLVEAMVERDSDGVRSGAIVEARWVGGPDRMAVMGGGEELYLPQGAKKPEGATIRVKIQREAISEASHRKRAVGVATELGIKQAPNLWARISSSWHDVRTIDAHGPDELIEMGWAELMEEAASGIIPFEGGLLRIMLTPAMVVVDVDGTIRQLTQKALVALAGTIRQLGIGGNLVVDLPTLADAGERKNAAIIFDRMMHEGGTAFERTAINGFGLLQVIMPRPRPSLLERVQLASLEHAALTLLRSAERARGTGPLTLTAHPAVTGWLEDHATLTGELARRSGRPVVLQADAAGGMTGGHAQ